MGKGGCSEVAAQPVYVRVNLFRPRKKVQLLGRQSPEVTDGKRYRAFYLSRATAKLPSTKMALIYPPTKRTQRYLSGAAFLTLNFFCQFDKGEKPRKKFAASLYPQSSLVLCFPSSGGEAGAVLGSGGDSV